MKCGLFVFTTLNFALHSGAQDDRMHSTQRGSASDFQVIESREVKLPDRSIFYHRIAPPSAQPKPIPAPVPAAPLSPAERAAEEARERKKHETLMFSATVYDREVTQVRWSYAGQNYRVFSNLDFNFLAGLGWFETADTVYSLMLGLGNDSRAQAAADRAAALGHGIPESAVPSLPFLSDFNASRAEYRFAPGDPAPPTEAVAGLEALHHHFDAHRADLIAKYHRRLAEQAERERQLREHPPKPKDTVIYHWGKPKRATPPALQGGDQ